MSHKIPRKEKSGKVSNKFFSTRAMIVVEVILLKVSEKLTQEKVVRLLRELWPENKYVFLVALYCRLSVERAVGLRSSALRPSGLVVGGREYFLPEPFLGALRRIADDRYIFPHRDYTGRHRTKQAVYTDFRRACAQLGYSRITPRQVLQFLI